MLRLFCGLIIVLHCLSAHAINVVLVNPTSKNETFWDLVTELSQYAAKDLNINLTVYYAESHRMVQSELIHQIVNGKEKPDYLIFMPYGGSVLRTFKTLEESKTPFVTLERAYDVSTVGDIGKPQEKYQYWLGEIYNDNIADGKRLADLLYRKAKTINVGTKHYQAVALNGDYYAESIDRSKGFSHYYQSKNNVDIVKVIPVHWNRKQASKLFLQLHRSIGSSHIVWAASDEIALGVLDVANQTDLIPNNDFVLGGFDLIPEALQAIYDGRMTGSIGGHFLQGVWALIKIYDYDSGITQTLKKGDDRAFIKSTIVDSGNIKRYIILSKVVDHSRVDFREFTLRYLGSDNPKDYQLSLKNYVEKLNKIYSQKRDD